MIQNSWEKFSYLFLSTTMLAPVLFKLNGECLNKVKEHKSESQTAITAWKTFIRPSKSWRSARVIKVLTSINSLFEVRHMPTMASTVSAKFDGSNFDTKLWLLGKIRIFSGLERSNFEVLFSITGWQDWFSSGWYWTWIALDKKVTMMFHSVEISWFVDWET